MKLGTFSQQVRERFSYTITYEDDLTAGDNVKETTVLVEPVGLIVDDVGVFNPRVRFWTTGGVSGVTYTVTFLTTTEDGATFEDEVVFKIKDI